MFEFKSTPHLLIDKLDLRPQHILALERLAPKLKGVEARAKALSETHYRDWVYAWWPDDEGKALFHKSIADKIVARRKYGIGHIDNSENLDPSGFGIEWD